MCFTYETSGFDFHLSTEEIGALLEVLTDYVSEMISLQTR